MAWKACSLSSNSPDRDMTYAIGTRRWRMSLSFVIIRPILIPGRHRSRFMEMQLGGSIQASRRTRRLLDSGFAFGFWAACVVIAIASSIVITPRQYREAVNLTDPGL